MSATTINYVHYSFNPCLGCRNAGSPGCDHCFARDIAHRFYAPCFDDNPRHLMSDAYWKQPLAWNRKAAKEGIIYRVLCGSMCDVFEEHDQSYYNFMRLGEIIHDTSNLFWMLLTKRPQNMKKVARLEPFIIDERLIIPSNVALGVTVETQAQIWRIEEMLKHTAPVYWVSHEPAIGRIDWPNEFLALGDRALIVTGGESGPKARPMHPDWARHDRDQCVEHGVNYWFKQWGEWAEYRNNGGSMYPSTDKTRLYQVGIDGAVYDQTDPMNDTDVCMGRVGTKHSGRLLDGQEWNQLPEVMR